MASGSNGKEAYAPLVQYIERVIPRAHEGGFIKSKYGPLARFAEALGDATRANVWSWVYVHQGLPFNRKSQIIKLNQKLQIWMATADLDKIFNADELRAARSETNPVRKLFMEIDRRARERNLRGTEIREKIADTIGVTLRMIYRYESLGEITPARKGEIKKALQALDLGISPAIIAAALE